MEQLRKPKCRFSLPACVNPISDCKGLLGLVALVVENMFFFFRVFTTNKVDHEFNLNEKCKLIYIFGSSRWFIREQKVE